MQGIKEYTYCIREKENFFFVKRNTAECSNANVDRCVIRTQGPA